MKGSGIRLKSNRPDLCIKFNVSSRICLFTESGKSLSPYNNSCNKTSFARSTYPSGRSNAKIPARRSRQCTSKQGQSNKKCSVSSMPSFVGHMGFVVSLNCV